MAIQMRCRYRLALFIVLAGSLSGCAVYHAAPLPTLPNLAQSLPATPMTMELIGRYAVDHSPDLIAARRRADVSTAQAYAGGLLPDPQLSASADHPTVHGLGLVNGYALGLSQDLQALLTEPSRAAAADAEQKQAELDLLWAEWGTLQKASNLYVEKLYGDLKAAKLQGTVDILQDSAVRSGRALERHNTTIDVAGADLSAALDIASQRDAAIRAAIAADADLKALLGLVPATTLALADPGDPPVISHHDVEQALMVVTQTRPDLLALQAGYHAQDESVRTAILQQFPAINLGFNRASDTSNIQSNGLGVSVTIPIFGSTQANIRVQRATRAQLWAEYQARLDQTTADAWRLWQDVQVLREQMLRLASSLPRLRHMTENARTAYLAGNLAPANYVLLQTSLSAREGELFDLRIALWQDTIALKMLLAMTPLIASQAAPT